MAFKVIFPCPLIGDTASVNKLITLKGLPPHIHPRRTTHAHQQILMLQLLWFWHNTPILNPVVQKLIKGQVLPTDGLMSAVCYFRDDVVSTSSLPAVIQDSNRKMLNVLFENRIYSKTFLREAPFYIPNTQYYRIEHAFAHDFFYAIIISL